MANLTYKEKIASYKKVFWILCALTTVEVVLMYMPIPKLLLTTLIVVASLAKAVYVGWIYMHLNHETKWLAYMVMMPVMIIFVYVVVLVAETPFRPISIYLEEPTRSHGARNLKEQPRDDFGYQIEAETPIESEQDSH